MHLVGFYYKKREVNVAGSDGDGGDKKCEQKFCWETLLEMAIYRSKTFREYSIRIHPKELGCGVVRWSSGWNLWRGKAAEIVVFAPALLVT